MSSKKNINRQAYRLALHHYTAQIKKQWRSSIPAIILPGIGSIFVFFVPSLVIAHVVDKIASDPAGQSPGHLIMYVLFAAGFWLLGEAIWRVALYFMVVYETRGIENLYNDAMRFLATKNIDFFNNNFAGSLTKNVSGYARNFERFTDTLSFNISANIIPIVFACFVLWRYSPWIVAVLLGMMTITVLLAFPLIKKRSELVAIREAASTQVVGHIADVIGNIPTVRAFGNEKQELSAHANNTRELIKKMADSWHYQNFRVDFVLSPMYVLTNALGLVAVILLINEPLSGGAIIVTFTYFATATRAMWEFNQIYRHLETSLTEAAQFTQYLLNDETIKDTSNRKLQVTNSQIIFDNVTFAYKDKSDDEVFNNLSIAIEPGEKIGLVGKSGSGKTTITKLLLRFMDIDGGRILIDSQNIAEVTQESLRHAISYVSQEPILFHRTLEDNIKYGKQDATREAVIKAAKSAHAHEFIQNLPHDYDTLVGERGVKLSGGQRQRVAIARAMLKDAPILVLDEATSALDSESEALIQDALWKLMEGRTAIVIAHRLSTIQKMDRIIVLNKGEIVEQGSHKELLKLSGTYAKLWAHQSGGFIEE